MPQPTQTRQPAAQQPAARQPAARQQASGSQASGSQVRSGTAATMGPPLGPAVPGIGRSFSGGFYKYQCKYFYTHNCPNWVYVNKEPCSRCMYNGRY
ncbi:hypothetical protein XA68_13050 [Ophiocordyceps unilateralis]|uniref:Uncharacterized protein n=1 Tax=Ophiocordyceps unilateralis TaxID=268505 RepID=A0A2A9PDE8_OPHUN|nr:hypothetical protein XA68_13050 [Ophiocordyceps unilateralis]